MNKAELVSHVAVEVSTTRAAAERKVGAVSAAIADALARDDPVVRASGSSPSEAAPHVRDAIPEPGSRSPYRLRRSGRSGRQKPFATRSTNSMMGQAATCSPSVSATRLPHVRTFETQLCKTSFPARRRRPTPFPSRTIHTRLVTERMGAGRRRTEFHPFSKRANMCTDHARTLDACGVATPYRRHPTSHATVSTIHREVIGVACQPARRSRPTFGPWTQARGASRSSGQPNSTHGRWTVRAPRVGSCVALSESKRRAPLNDAIAHGTSA